VNSYSVTYSTINAGTVNETTMLITAAKFYLDGDNVFFMDDQDGITFMVPNSRQPVVKVMSS
jgi:hypothetical protein